jgi:HK97 family phage prohead protease
MPWHVAKSSQCPTSKPWAVIKDSDSSVAGCHATKGDAQKQLAALYANEASMSAAPTDNLVRAWARPEATSLRAASDGDGSTMFGHFAVFNQWTEIDSWFEGRFLEQIAPGAFKETFRAKADQIRVLYDHGADPQIGNKPLGTPDVLREDRQGAYYEVGLFDASYVNDLKPAINARQLGASFRFRVTGEEWSTPSESSKANPQQLDERTITGVELYEFGPVTFPAYPDASAGLRSRTDEFLEHFLNDPLFVARFKERVGPAVVNQIRAGLPTAAGDPAAPPAPGEPPEPAPTGPDGEPATADGGEEEDTQQRRLAYFARKTAGFDAYLTRLKEA